MDMLLEVFLLILPSLVAGDVESLELFVDFFPEDTFVWLDSRVDLSQPHNDTLRGGVRSRPVVNEGTFPNVSGRANGGVCR